MAQPSTATIGSSPRACASSNRVLKVLTVLMVLMVLRVGAGSAAQARTASEARTISGKVVDAATGRPVSAALVTLSLVKIEGTPILTGSDGRFTFRVSQPAGSYTVTARKGGYAEGGTGRLRPGGALQPVRLDASTPAADVVIRIWKLGAITGTVVDEAGE